MSTALVADQYVPFFEKSSPPAETGVAGGAATSDKAAVALKNHSEAEKRRRERINGHLATLRTLIPGSSKMEKSTLLANAITHLKELQKAATEATKDLVIPLDSDEIVVEKELYVSQGETLVCVKATVCCDYTHEILTDMKRSLNVLQMKLLRVELGTFQGRMKSIFYVSPIEIQDSRSKNKCVSVSVKRALKSILDDFYANQELSISSEMFLSKRKRIPLTSPSGDMW